ncbi:hypothetical protein DMI82_07360 [Blautia sp. BCRC 81119]|nr:hypothetical protein DMI82_07360 [Blautia sp. BCRC 81119]
MAFATMNASPPRTCRMRNAPPGKEIHSRMRNAPPGKKIHSRMRNAPPGKEKPHAKCSLPERDSLPIDFMLE